MNGLAMKIVAPVCSVADAESVITAGADELYVGAMFDEWTCTFGDSDLLTRRQGRSAHIRTSRELASVVNIASQAGRPIALAINARYDAVQIRAVLDLVTLWEETGGAAVIVADIGLLLALAQRNSHMNRHLSLLAGAFNSLSVTFFAELGVSRVILPRDLTLGEVADLTAGSGNMEFEMVAMYQKCHFIDGMCGFHHATRLPSGVSAEFDYVAGPGTALPVVWAQDPEYEGHGCELPWRSLAGPVRWPRRDDLSSPNCAACQLPAMARSGIRYVKLAGRAYSSDMIVRAIRFLRSAMEAWQTGDDSSAQEDVRRLYSSTFGSACSCRDCYYNQ
ncbi:MAG TPA: U32 family peptidase [Verrucomicrobiae bacterium]|nr:U32 family peptidase [Verrucomicrobiae bacterium]